MTASQILTLPEPEYTSCCYEPSWQEWTMIAAVATAVIFATTALLFNQGILATGFLLLIPAILLGAYYAYTSAAYAGLQEQVTNLNNVRKDLTDQVQTLQTENETFTNNNNELRSQVEEIRSFTTDKFPTLFESWEKCKNEITALLLQKTTISCEVEHLTSARTGLQEDVNSLHAVVEELKKHAGQLPKTLETFLQKVYIPPNN